MELRFHIMEQFWYSLQCNKYWLFIFHCSLLKFLPLQFAWQDDRVHKGGHSESAPMPGITWQSGFSSASFPLPILPRGSTKEASLIILPWTFIIIKTVNNILWIIEGALRRSLTSHTNFHFLADIVGPRDVASHSWSTYIECLLYSHLPNWLKRTFLQISFKFEALIFKVDVSILKEYILGILPPFQTK